MRPYRPFALLVPLCLLAACGQDDADPCQAIDCTIHGRCVVQGGAATCQCDDGYVAHGQSCITDACRYLVCVHGSCRNEDDGPVCLCNAGYSGDNCDACAPGYHAEGLACIPEQPCEQVLCIHGSCHLDQGTPSCLCDPAYAGQACDLCAPGYHPQGLSCLGNSPCDPDPCIHGRCTESNGAATCSCETGYTGETCQLCAPGYGSVGLVCLPEAPDPCRPNPCTQDHRTICLPQDGGFACRCDPATHDEDGACVPDTVCDPTTTCLGHGECTGEDLACSCHSGYTGAYCESCAPGYHPVGLDCEADPPCEAATTCSGHGDCADEGCLCHSGYTGPHCESCAGGYHGEDDTCVPDTVCDPATTCLGHGDCTGEDLACSCHTGYTGIHCESCAGGYHGEDDTCVPDTVCDPATTCLGHGDCTGEDLACFCHTGYEGESCEACAEGYLLREGLCRPESSDPCDPNPCQIKHRTVCVPNQASHLCECDEGYQDQDGDGTCLADCSSLICGADSHCEVQGGQADCLCDEGYQDHDRNSSCQPNCATAALGCPEGEICSDASGTARCVSGVKPPIYISFHWHMHQPIYYPYESIIETESTNHAGYSVYAIHNDRTGPYTSWPRDAIDSGRGEPHLGAQVSFSGSLMENLTHMAAAGAGFGGWTNAWREAMAWRTSGGNPRLDLVRFGYHHPLMGLIDPLDTRLQLQAHRQAAERSFGALPSRGIFPPECAFSERMIPALVAEGVEWALVDNIHFDRAHRDYPFDPGSNLPRPNRADQVNGDPTDWLALRDLWAPGQVSAPWGYQPHYVEHTDPASGQKHRMIAVPAARYEGNEDARGGFGALQYDKVLSQYEHLNTDPAHPMLVVLHHDGDNYGGGTESYYHANFQAFVAWVSSQPDRFVATTIQDYLDRFPPDPADVIHVEDGSWSGADNGDPEFMKWNGDPDDTGYSPDRNSWAVVTAAKNRVLTAEAIQANSSAQAIVDGGGSDTDKAWHYLLNAETSCYWYWDNSQGGLWDSHPARAANQAVDHADAVIAQGRDSIGPTIYLPQREPYNPGQDAAPRDFTVWTLAYDASGLGEVTLHWRVDGDGVRDASNEVYEGGSWQQAPMAGQTLVPHTDPMPRYQADQFQADIDDLSEALVDYYVSAMDSLGHETRSPLMHVWVGDSGGTPSELWEPAQPTASDTIIIYWGQPASLHWGVDGWNAPPAEYWPAGSTLWTDNKAIESPLSGPDGEGRYTIALGPFDGTAVGEVNFVFHNDDGSWSSPDMTIPIQ